MRHARGDAGAIGRSARDTRNRPAQVAALIWSVVLVCVCVWLLHRAILHIPVRGCTHAGTEQAVVEIHTKYSQCTVINGWVAADALHSVVQVNTHYGKICGRPALAVTL